MSSFGSVNGRRIDDMSGVWWLRLKTKVLPREEPSSAHVEGEVGYCSGRRGSSTGSGGRRRRRLFRWIQQKKVPQATFPGRGRTCGTFFRMLPILLAEEHAKLLPRSMFCYFLVIFLENFV